MWTSISDLGIVRIVAFDYSSSASATSEAPIHGVVRNICNKTSYSLPAFVFQLEHYSSCGECGQVLFITEKHSFLGPQHHIATADNLGASRLLVLHVCSEKTVFL